MKKDAPNALDSEFGDEASADAKPMIVIVDDDPMILSSLKLILSKLYHVETYSNAVEGVAAAVRHDVALVILDIKMPQHDGFWAFARIREAGQQAPIIFNSAYQDAKLPEEIQAKYKPFAYLSKNGDVRDFLEKVRAALAQR